MRTGRLLSLLVTAVWLAAHSIQPAISANPEVLYDSGPWGVYRGDDQSKDACTLVLANNGRAFILKWHYGDRYLQIGLYKKAWAIPNDTKLEFRLQVDRADVWSFPAIGNSQSVAGYIDTGDPMLQLFQQLQRGAKVVFYFPSGNEQPWSSDLLGSTAALAMFSGCVSEIVYHPKEEHTQPFGVNPQADPSAPVPSPKGRT